MVLNVNDSVQVFGVNFSPLSKMCEKVVDLEQYYFYKSDKMNFREI